MSKFATKEAHDKQKARCKKWYRDNHEHALAYAKDRRVAKPEVIRKQRKKSYYKHRGRYNAIRLTRLRAAVQTVTPSYARLILWEKGIKKPSDALVDLMVSRLLTKRFINRTKKEIQNGGINQHDRAVA